MLNSYFEIMVDVVLKYNGTINEIIGDALLVIFGAPQEMPDRAQRAIACAITMQNAMTKVNNQNRERGLPELEMGIGLNETEVQLSIGVHSESIVVPPPGQYGWPLGFLVGHRPAHP